MIILAECICKDHTEMQVRSALELLRECCKVINCDSMLQLTWLSAEGNTHGHQQICNDGFWFPSSLCSKLTKQHNKIKTNRRIQTMLACCATGTDWPGTCTRAASSWAARLSALAVSTWLLSLENFCASAACTKSRRADFASSRSAGAYARPPMRLTLAEASIFKPCSAPFVFLEEFQSSDTSNL